MGKNGQQANSHNGNGECWRKLEKNPDWFAGYQLPRVSVVIPAYNVSTPIQRTLDSVMHQDYPDLEVIVIDAGSTDRTREIVAAYKAPNVRTYYVYENDLYDMLNKGIDLASGRYVNLLYPGGFYISPQATKHMMALAQDHQEPHLVFGGAIIAAGGAESKVLFRPMDVSYLRMGHQPTSLESCWFRRDLFEQIGPFRSSFRMRGGFDIMCRIVKEPALEVVSTSRVVTDYVHRPFTRTMILRHFWETLQIIATQFGFAAACRWLFHQRDILRWAQSWLRSLKVAVVGGR